MRRVAVLFTAALLAASCSSGTNDTTTAVVDAETTTVTTIATTTVPTTTTMPAIPDDPTVAPALIEGAWTDQGTVDDWLTEPVMLDGAYYATRKGLDGDTQQEVDGLVEGAIEEVGELWISPDGVTWLPADEGEQPPPASLDTRTDGAAVVVRQNPIADQCGMRQVSSVGWSTRRQCKRLLRPMGAAPTRVPATGTWACGTPRTPKLGLR
jgi:hypothetical protein